MDQRAIFVTILGMTAVTYVPRLLPIWFLSSRSMPRLVVAWLRYVPVAVLAAMLIPSLVVREGRIDVGIDNLFLWAAVPTFLVAHKTRSLFGPVVVGMILVAAARFLFAA